MENTLLAMLGFTTANQEMAQLLRPVNPDAKEAALSFAELFARFTGEKISQDAELLARIEAIQREPDRAETLDGLDCEGLSSAAKSVSVAEEVAEDNPEVEPEQETETESELQADCKVDEVDSEGTHEAAKPEYSLQGPRAQIETEPDKMEVLDQAPNFQPQEQRLEPVTGLTDQNPESASQNEQVQRDVVEQVSVEPRNSQAEDSKQQANRQVPDDLLLAEQSISLEVDRKLVEREAIAANKPKVQPKSQAQPKPEARGPIQPNPEMPLGATEQAKIGWATNGSESTAKVQPAVETDKGTTRIVENMAAELNGTVEFAPKQPKSAGRPSEAVVRRDNMVGEQLPVEDAVSGKIQEHPAKSGLVAIGRGGEVVLLAEEQAKPTIKTLHLVDKPATGNSEQIFDGQPQVIGRNHQSVEPALPVRPNESVVTGRFPEVLEDQITRFSTSTTEGEAKVIRIKLVPAELGEIQVELRMHEGKVLGQINTQQASTRELVYNNLNQLRGALESQGIQVSNLVVSQSAVAQFAWDGSPERRSQFANGKRDGRRGDSESQQELKIQRKQQLRSQVSMLIANPGLDLRM